jgi:hypothetical protein
MRQKQSLPTVLNAKFHYSKRHARTHDVNAGPLSLSLSPSSTAPPPAKSFCNRTKADDLFRAMPLSPLASLSPPSFFSLSFPLFVPRGREGGRGGGRERSSNPLPLALLTLNPQHTQSSAEECVMLLSLPPSPSQKIV